VLTDLHLFWICMLCVLPSPQHHCAWTSWLGLFACASPRGGGATWPTFGSCQDLFESLIQVLHHRGCTTGMVGGNDSEWHLPTTILIQYDDHPQECRTTVVPGR